MKNIFLSVLCAIFFFSTDKSIASHAVGADLTYLCLGGNNYRFFFTLYRDCLGIGVSPSYTIEGASTCGGSVSITVNLDSTSEIRRTCPGVVTTCVDAGSPIMGIEANYYHGDVTLPSACNYWTFGLSPAICNRNAAINRLSPNGSFYCLYVEAKLDNATVQCNNSPAFSGISIPFLCANQVQFYYQNAYDVDNDTIGFQMYTPHSDSVSDVQYIAGLSSTQPVTYTVDSTQFESSTGQIRFHADVPQITVIGVRVNDNRNGSWIGSVERDIQLIFETCSGGLQNPPVATGMNGTSSFTAHICYDSLFSFQIYTSDADSDSTFVGWTQPQVGATLTTIPGLFETGIISWRPDSSDISTFPYIFTINVTANSCPIISTNTYSFQIFVDSCHATTGIGVTRNNIHHFSAGYSPNSGSVIFHYMLNNPCEAMISLYDIIGRPVKNRDLEKSVETRGELDVSDLASGVYLLNLKTKVGMSQTAKLVID